MENRKIKIIFMGTPDFGAIILEKLVQAGFQPDLVITANDKPVGRKQIITPPPVKITAEKYQIPILQTNKTEFLFSEIEKIKPDLGIAAAYGKKIPEELLDLPKFGFLNVHPSLLPRWRGCSPIQYAILSGDKETGVTIMRMTKKFDAGPIISQIKVEDINPEITYLKLHDILAKKGADLLLKTIPDWVNNKIKPVFQDEAKTTKSKILKKEDGKIDWQKSAEDIERQIRAFYSWPGSFTFWENKKLLKIKILKARLYKKNVSETYPIGKTLVAPQNELCIQTGKGFLMVETMQLEGGREMNSEDFIRGHDDFIGTILK